MPSFRQFIAEASKFISGENRERRANPPPPARIRTGCKFDFLAAARNFDADYNAAFRILRDRLDRKYPQRHSAMPTSRAGDPYDYSDSRALAVDTMSTAIAMALRNGASVWEAAEAGAVSIDI